MTNLALTEFQLPREVIIAVEQLLNDTIAQDSSLNAIDSIPLQHEFIPGAYARGMRVAAGTLLVGKIHRKSCFNFVLSGACVVWGEFGRQDILAPLFFISPPGTKRIIYAVQDLIWYNVHGSNETDLARLETELIAPSYADLSLNLVEEDC